MKPSLATISLQRSLTQTAFKENAPLSYLPPALHCFSALCFCHLSQLLQRSSWNPVSNNRTKTFSVQSAISHQHLHQPFRVAPFWPRKVPFGPIKLQGFGVLICMRTDQSGTRTGNLCLHKSAPLWLTEHTFPFHQILKTAFPQLEQKHQRCLAGAELSRQDWSRADQSRAV